MPPTNRKPETRQAPAVYQPCPAREVVQARMAMAPTVIQGTHAVVQGFYLETPGGYKWMDDKHWDANKYEKSPKSKFCGGWWVRNLYREKTMPSAAPRPVRRSAPPAAAETVPVSTSAPSDDDDDFYSSEELAKSLGLGGRIRTERKRVVPPSATSTASPGTTRAQIAAEADRIIAEINRRRDTGPRLEIRSDLSLEPTNTQLLCASLRRYHNQPARRSGGFLRFYVSDDVTRGIHVTIHQWEKGRDTHDTLANYHIR
jgi:hypothetical protein